MEEIKTSEKLLDKVSEAILRLKPYGEVRIQMTPCGEIIIYETRSEKINGV